MSSKQVIDSGLARRLAIEQQLLAEEKFVVEALKNIKKQRNSLQIEKLHLMGLLGQIMMKKSGESQMAATSQESSEQDPVQESSELLLRSTRVFPVQEFPSFSMDDEVCNGEELNLTVPQHTFHQPTNNDLEAIVEFENAEMDYEIDINMLMSGLDGVM